jgi:hypothetical protein
MAHVTAADRNPADDELTGGVGRDGLTIGVDHNQLDPGAHVRHFVEELSAGAAGAGGADGCRDQRSACVRVGGGGRGCPAARCRHGETVRKWVRQAEVDVGSRPGTTTEESAGLKLLRRENAALRGAAVFEDPVGFLRGSPRRAACPSRSSPNTVTWLVPNVMGCRRDPVTPGQNGSSRASHCGTQLAPRPPSVATGRPTRVDALALLSDSSIICASCSTSGRSSRVTWSAARRSTINVPL